MSFHIGEALLLDRTVAIAITIVVFGVVAIGGLYLLKRLSRSPKHPVARDHSQSAEIEAIFRRIEALTRKQS